MSNGGETTEPPLAGLRVIDLTTSYAGPTGSMYLADLGADVIKIERPTGDDARAWGPPFVDGTSAWFASANRNKRSIALDLRNSSGLETLIRLIGAADVFIENVNPSRLSRLGLDPETLMLKFPRLIYCAVSGFGLDGPDQAKPGYDLIAQARSGMMSVTGAKGGPPQRVSSAVSDIVTGMCAALAVSAAVVRQRETSLGDLIDVSLLDADLALMAPRIAAFVAGEPEPQPSGGTDSVLSIYQTFPTADRTLAVAIGNDAIWLRFCDAVGLPELGADPELSTNALRRARRAELIATLSEHLRTRTAAEWMRLLGVARVPCTEVLTLSQVVTDSHVQARGNLMPVPDTEETMVTVRSPFRLRSAPEPRNQRYPDLGGHTRDILAEYGFELEEVEQLFASGAIREATEPTLEEVDS